KAAEVVEKCAAEAKIVAVEQEIKKAADAKAKAAALASGATSVSASAAASSPATITAKALREAFLTAGDEPATPPAPPSGDGAADATGATPGAMESVEGSAPEVVVHDEGAAAAADELSPEEQAVGGV